VNGLAYPAEDVRALAATMVRLVTERHLAAHLATGARATAVDLSWEREMERLDQSYREVCEAAAERAA
jgi:glycosyltransferase involved in cell wall biosynthesis